MRSDIHLCMFVGHQLSSYDTQCAVLLTCNSGRRSEGLHWFQACREAHCVLKVTVAVGKTGTQQMGSECTLQAEE